MRNFLTIMANTNNSVHTSHTVKLNSIQNIKIISINVNSIIKNQRRASLLNLIKKENPDIVLLGETKLNKNHVLRFEQYHIIRNDRNAEKPGGGTAILIKKSFNYSNIPLSQLNTNSVLETSVIKCNINSGKTLFIISAYARCGNQKEFIPELSELFSTLELQNLNNYYILAGDLNAKHSDWRNYNNNPRGISLAAWLAEYSLKYRIHFLSSEYPTYPNGNLFLDIVLTDARLTFLNLTNDKYITNVPYDSDHCAISFEMSLEDDDRLLPANTTNNIKLNYRTANWNKFKETLANEHLPDIPSNRNLSLEEIDKHIHTCNLAIQNAIDKTIPKIKEKNSLNPYLNHKIHKLQNKKNKILTQIHRLSKKWPNVNNYRLKYFKKELYLIRNELKLEFSSSINNYWNEKISKITKKDSTNIFSKINSIFRKKDIAEVASLRIDGGADILAHAAIDTDKLPKDNSGKVLIENLSDKLNVMAPILRASITET